MLVILPVVSGNVLLDNVLFTRIISDDEFIKSFLFDVILDAKFDELDDDASKQQSIKLASDTKNINNLNMNLIDMLGRLYTQFLDENLR